MVSRKEVSFPVSLADYIVTDFLSCVKTFREEVMEEQVKLYSAEEVSKMLNCSVDFIYDRIQDHTFRCYKFGRTRRFSMEQVHDFMDRMEINKE